ncbi:MAG TPA: branched-chain amino acid ABC transporter permease [bacterium]
MRASSLRLLSAAAALAVLIILPALGENSAPARPFLNWAFLVLLYGALSQSWNLLSGFGGQVNLGHAALFGLGALVTRLLWLQHGVSFPLALLAGTGAAGLLGIIIGAPSLRLRGPYFAIGTLAIAEILRITTGNLFPEVSYLPSALLNSYRLLPRYYLALALGVLVTLAAVWMTRSRFGYGLAAVREDEDVAEALGVSAYRHKLLAFALSAVFAGLAGGVFAYYHVSFYPQFPFGPIWTFDALLITFLGGVGSVWGPWIGAGIFLLLREALALRLVELHLLIFGILFIVMVLVFPGGFVEAWHGLVRARREAAAARASKSVA